MTCLDIHDTLLYFITNSTTDSRSHYQGKVLLDYINPAERSCQYYKWNSNFCKCPVSLDIIY